MKRLDPQDYYDHAQDLIQAAEERDALYDRLDALYDHVKPETSSEDAASVQIVTMPYASNAVDLVTDLAAAQEITIAVTPSSESKSDQQTADDQESWLRAYHSLIERSQARGLTGEMAWCGTQRAQVALRTVFFDSLLDRTRRPNGAGYTLRRLPVLLQVRDPRYVYHEDGPEGVEFVAESWTRSAGEIKRYYPGALDDDLDNRADVEWVETWDKDYRAYFADGKPVSFGKTGVKVVKHGYGCLPYAFGNARVTPRSATDKRYRPLLMGVEGTLRNLDTAFSILATAGWASVANAWAVQSDSYGRDGGPELALGPGAINYLGKDETIQAVQRAELPGDFFQMLSLLLQALQQGTFPFAMFGEGTGNLAGYAINLMTQSGRRALLPVWSAIERAYAGAFRNIVMICREKVAPLVGDNISLLVANEDQAKGKRRNLVLDVTKITDDWDCSVTLKDPMPADEAQNMRLAIETTKAGLLSQQTTLSRFQVVPDAVAEMERIQAERIFNQLAPLEAIKLAQARGYIPANANIPAGWHVEKGQVVPDVLFPQAPAQPVQPPTSEQPNPADMQALSGQMPILPDMAQMAGMAPPEPQMMGGIGV